MRKPARSKGVYAAHLLRACFCIFRNSFLVRYTVIVMPIAPNTHFDHYEIIAPLGAGGMGEVYRAKDTCLNRDVAIKILPAEFAQDAR